MDNNKTIETINNRIEKLEAYMRDGFPLDDGMKFEEIAGRIEELVLLRNEIEKPLSNSEIDADIERIVSR